MLWGRWNMARIGDLQVEGWGETQKTFSGTIGDTWPMGKE